MPAVQTRQTRPAKLAAGLAGGVVLAVVAALSLIPLLAGQPSCQGVGDPAPSAEARKGIPADYLVLYRQAAREYGVPWAVLAAVGSVETDHGRLDAAGVRSGQNFHGCCAGPMQFHNNYGAGGGTWGAYAVDGDADGRKNIYDPADAIPSAARYLKASGAPGDLRAAVFAYNHAGWYVDRVLATARSYAGQGPTALAASPVGVAGDCPDGGGLLAGGRRGKWTLAPGANAPGRPLTPQFTRFVDLMAGVYPGRLVLTTGTNHSKYTTTGDISDHWSGNAGDFGMVANGGTDDGPVGDRIAAAALLVANLPRDEAVERARQGGSIRVVRGGLRVQVIWKSDVGGNHHNHDHVGIADAG